MSVLTLPETERPRERLLALGPDAMTTVELIAVLLGSGTRSMPVLQLAEELVRRFGSSLPETSIEELCQVPGMGQTKAIQLKAALSLSRRFERKMAEGRIASPEQLFLRLKPLVQDERRELFIAVLLDTKGGVIGHEVIAIGTLSRILVHPREVFFPAVRRKAASLILAHNHPSGDLTPSPEDIQLTEALVEAGRMMGIPIRDHLILSADGYHSLREGGLRFT